jgi:hypothetical protein
VLPSVLHGGSTDPFKLQLAALCDIARTHFHNPAGARAPLSYNCRLHRLARLPVPLVACQTQLELHWLCRDGVRRQKFVQMGPLVQA